MLLNEKSVASVLLAILTPIHLLLTACTSTPPPSVSVSHTPTAQFSTTQSLVTSIDAPDPYTIRFTLNQPDVAFLQKLAFPAFGIQSPANIEKFDGGGDLIRNPVGTGPFRFVEWVQEDRITLERNESYWGELPATRRLTYRVIPEASARFLELQTGTVHGVDNLSPDDIPAAQLR